ncbi:transposase [Sphingosinicella sp. LHD-64]|uniref:transposase n=1 Tax=Sphingosinicella sp. LHD-64 TaxID=3072139 RepID=UPI00280FEC57|nr:transposase [Sphingosinicella sp. LHD-64]MDQ8755367.1 transposase [Sphingosinicella sp. LHD-64]
MPRVIDCPTEESCELGELVERLETGPFDPRDEDGFCAWGHELKKLANNRRFLADLMIAELKQRCLGQVRDNHYTAQVVLLHASAQRFVIRANFWPALNDSMVRHSGTDPFFYHKPHDHNFSFLTVGYLGPGYWSDYYEYDYEKVVGIPGEKVDLRFIERSKLDPGKVMLYRAHRDVHDQLPADEMSVSINILETAHAAIFRDQYGFNVRDGTIERIMTRTSLEPMLALAAHYGGEEGTDLLAEFARSHPSDRVRWCALHARAGAAATLDARIALFEDAADSGSLLVAGMAQREVGRLEAGRGWIEGAYQPAA